MNRILGFVLFFTVFMSIYFAMNFYVLYRITTFFNLPRGLFFYVLVSLSACSYVLGTVLEKNLPCLLTKAVYVLSAVWMGVMFLLLCVMVLYEVVTLFVAIPPNIAGIVVLSVVGLLTLISFVNIFFLNVEVVDVPMPGIEEEVTVVQLSDVHIGSIWNSGFLKKIAGKVNSLKPDVVVITGDLFDGTAPLRPDMLEPLDSIEAPILFVTGNHEMYEGIENVKKVIENTKLEHLSSRVTEMKGVQFVGIDYSQDGSHLIEILRRLKINKTEPAVLLYHDPKNVRGLRDEGIDLQLSGHTHNGQIFPFNFLVRLEYKYLKGLYEVDGLWLYVSPGTGTWGPPMRLGSRNEITVLKLLKVS